MKYLFRTTLSAIAIIVFTGCASKQVLFPEADIVYQSISANDFGEATYKSVGFVNADGSGDKTIELYERPSRPVYSKELEGLIFLEAKNAAHIFGLVGDIAFLSESGKFTVCNKLPNGSFDYSFPISGTKNLLVNTLHSIEIVDIDTCVVVKTLVSPSSEIKFRLISSAHISESGQWVIFAVDWGDKGLEEMARIVLLNTQTNEFQEMPFTGGNPTLSPDGEKITYVGANGIYISDITSKNPTLLISINEAFMLGDGMPYPFWSPDGEWLVYHKCINKSCYRLEDFSIFKVDVSSGEETKIKDGGMFPVWIN